MKYIGSVIVVYRELVENGKLVAIFPTIPGSCASTCLFYDEDMVLRECCPKTMHKITIEIRYPLSESEIYSNFRKQINEKFKELYLYTQIRKVINHWLYKEARKTTFTLCHLHKIVKESSTKWF
jgi:hypothetical protein